MAPSLFPSAEGSGVAREEENGDEIDGARVKKRKYRRKRRGRPVISGIATEVETM